MLSKTIQGIFSCMYMDECISIHIHSYMHICMFIHIYAFMFLHDKSSYCENILFLVTFSLY